MIEKAEARCSLNRRDNLDSRQVVTSREIVLEMSVERVSENDFHSALINPVADDSTTSSCFQNFSIALFRLQFASVLITQKSDPFGDSFTFPVTIHPKTVF